MGSHYATARCPKCGHKEYPCTHDIQSNCGGQIEKIGRTWYCEDCGREIEVWKCNRCGARLDYDDID